jgi:hypothetical protein
LSELTSPVAVRVWAASAYSCRFVLFKNDGYLFRHGQAGVSFGGSNRTTATTIEFKIVVAT